MKTGFCLIHGVLNEENADICITKYVKRGWRLRCKECSKISKKKMYDKTRDRQIQIATEWAKNNRERINKRKKEDRLKNPNKYRAWEAGKYKKAFEKHGDAHRVKQILRKYKITVDNYFMMIEQQDNKCAICRKEETKMSTRSLSGPKISPLGVDHCHKTGKVRALLCRKCNLGLGAFDDDIERMEVAIKYLRIHIDASA